MKIVIKKRYDIQNLFFGTVLKSELHIDINKKYIEYCREYIPFNIDTPTIDKKINFTIQGLLDISFSKFNYLLDLLEKIKENNIELNINVDKNNVLDYLKYIDLNIDGQDYSIDINSLEYEMLVHLSTFEFYDSNEIQHIEKKNKPIPTEII